jgi:hypothetical protein
MDFASYPREALRSQLSALGIPDARQQLGALLDLLPVKLNGKPFEQFDADSAAEVLIYLARKQVLSLPLPLLPCLSLRWGECLRQACSGPQELLETVLAYFRQGLAGHERCIWLLGAALTSRMARQAIARIDDLRDPGDQLEIADYADWAPDGEYAAEDLFDNWAREETRARAQGYRGLRVCVDAGQDFAALEAKMREAIGALRIKVLCTYS